VVAPDQTPVLLEARDLHKEFATGGALALPGARRRPRISAVAGVNLTLHAGETLGIVGESGCGKSTLARMLVGLERPDAGQVFFRGTDVTRLKGRARVGQLLALVGLDPSLSSRYAHEFSGGQRQRIGIARALALEPEVLVCDEPVSSLDVSVQAQVVNLLSDLQRQLGLALVFIAHDLALVRAVADRIAVMYLGRIVEVGPTEDVLANPSHPYTKALLSVAGEGMAARTTRPVLLKGEPPDSTRIPDGCRFHPRCPALASGAAEAAGVAGACRSTDLPIIPAAAGHAAACHLVSAS
jgi:oligopeptide transport system ATP-binding protein